MIEGLDQGLPAIEKLVLASNGNCFCRYQKVVKI